MVSDKELETLSVKFHNDLIDLLEKNAIIFSDAGVNACNLTAFFLESINYIGGAMAAKHDIDHLTEENGTRLGNVSYDHFQALMEASLKIVARGAVLGYYNTFVDAGALNVKKEAESRLSALDTENDLNDLLKQFQTKYGKPDGDGGTH